MKTLVIVITICICLYGAVKPLAEKLESQKNSYEQAYLALQK